MFKFFYSFLLISFSFLSVNTYSQSYYKVWFKDKQSDYKISNPDQFLSAKSIERRLLQQIPVTDSDLPVSPIYLQELQSVGAEIIYISRWLNMVIVKSQLRSFRTDFSEKPFIKSIKSADYLFTKNHSGKIKPFFDKEQLERLPGRSSRLKHIEKTNGSYQYGPSANQIQMIGVDHLHDMGFTGSGVIIGVIDAGFNSVNIHAAFDSLRMNGQILGTRDFVQPGNDVYATSMSGHGTMVLSTMGANLPGQLIGTAPKANYWLLRSEDANAEYLLEEYYWVNAAEFADSVGVDIINSSLGYSLFDNPDENHTYEDMDGNTTVVTIGADMAASKGILVVNSAGNSGSNSWQFITAPADGDSVFTIGAVDASGEYAYFSSKGPTYDGRIKPDVSSQGVGTIVAALPTGVGSGNGTSFSSPIIAGAAACLWQANPTFSNMELINSIRTSASRSANPDNLTGWGIPDFLEANNLLVSSLLNTYNPFKIITVFPNPFTERINIEIGLTDTINAKINLINSNGKKVAGLNEVTLPTGKNRISLNNLNKLPRGIYLLQISDGIYTTTEKVIK
ncbi:MAG: S8 family serine peptidase [Lentimicrobium sp.]|nr:S8 family serine peptidase [Lentimicrobium sp.]